MLFHEAAKRTKICLLPSELEGDINNAFPIGWITGCVGGRLEASRLYGTNGGVAEAVAEVADDAEDLNGAGRGDPETHGDGAFNMQLDGLRGVLWTGFKENFGCRAGGGI
jgi:hypothetical protein